eukprot:5504482-Amphidinium_carterae.1
MHETRTPHVLWIANRAWNRGANMLTMPGFQGSYYISVHSGGTVVALRESRLQGSARRCAGEGRRTVKALAQWD